MKFCIAKFEREEHLFKSVPSENTLPAWKKHLGVFLSTGFYSGFFPVAPGTAGSVVGMVFVYLLRDSGTFLQALSAVFFSVIGVWVSNIASQVFKKHDPQRVVIDEIAGVMITMIGIPLTGYTGVMGFLLFRFFDIVKPIPANFADRKLKGGLGIMLDDIIAGIYGNIVMHLVMRSQI